MNNSIVSKQTGTGASAVRSASSLPASRISLPAQRTSEAQRKGAAFRLRSDTYQTALATVSEGNAEALAVLVVDDEPMICELTARLLADAGHRICTTTDPREALRMATAEPFDLVITDRAMPLMSGEALASAIKIACPSTKILLVTGSGSDEIRSTDVDRVIAKPFTPDSLRRGVAEVLAISASPLAARGGLAASIL